MTPKEAYQSSLFLGVCAALLCIPFTTENPVIGYSFLSTFGAYLFLRKQSVRAYAPAFIGAISLLIWHHSPIHIVFACISALIAVLYQLPYGFSLRNHSVLKPLSISFAWTLNTVLISSSNQFEFIPNDRSVVLSCTSIFVITFILALYYDLIERDKEEHKSALAVQLGLEKTNILSIALFIVLIILHISVFGHTTKETVALAGATVYIIFIQSKFRAKKATTYIIDACFVVYALLLILGKNFI